MKEIPLTKGYKALVDDADFEYLNQFCWHTKLYKGVPYAARSFYDAKAWEERLPSHTKTILMHRELVGAEASHTVDHANRITLDNQQKNLRVCSRAQNSANSKLRKNNSSGFMGVTWKQWRDNENSGGAWCARITISGKRKQLGYFSTAKEAAQVRDCAAIEHFGEYAMLNFPKQESVGGLFPN